MKNFSIKQGKHYSNFYFDFTIKKEIDFTVIFKENCLYPIDKNNENSYDINKLFGLSDDYTHMKNSLRIGWTCENNKNIKLFSFIHNNYQFNSELLCTVNPEEEIKIKLIIYDKEYGILVYYKDKIIYNKYKRTSNWNIPFRYILKPYFGGNLVAPKDLDILIDY
jgi:hypothetical protein